MIKGDWLTVHNAAQQAPGVTAWRVAQPPVQGPALVQQLCPRLHTQSLVWGGLWADSIASTNRLACDLAARQAPEGLLIGADFQQAGQGRHGRHWHCAAGQGLLCSLILRPFFLRPRDSFLITQWATVSIVQALTNLMGVAIRLKWPNDILWQNRKLGGILTQASLVRPDRAWAVTGWGINLDQRISDWPVELQDKAVSLHAISGADIDHAVLLAAILQAMDHNWKLLRSGDYAPLSCAWLSFTDLLGRQITVRRGRRDYHGQVIDITAQGELVLTLDSGDSRAFLSGEIIALQ
jgi:BirA family transcriptional regulator, biotin operon repressor / biotin---[acetyl-CoA-carboxylase] ligase